MEKPPLQPGARKRLEHIDRLLAAAYGTPEHKLGNRRNPLDEAVYIILSFQTNLDRFKSSWLRLRAAYPSWARLENAPASAISTVLREGGLHRQKSRTIKQLLRAVRELTGGLTLNSLRKMTDADAERVLTRLPGLSWKAARCILLYSLDREVFPVDGNTVRILKRCGVLSPHAVYRRRAVHDSLQSAVQPSRRRALHVNLVVHGQRICLPRGPVCSQCPIRAACPRVGLPAATERAVTADGRGSLRQDSRRKPQ
jgi:endonuclease III